ncbi:MAG: disulfide reductase, partial [Deltaproteobacteria bacterium]
VLVVGGGIAGMQAALDIAEAGYGVFLLEKEPWIGGHMVQLDKTFPTNDCAMCTISPKLNDIAQNPNITLLTNSRLKGLEGEAGHFRVKVLRKPRYIREELCTGCGTCQEKCPQRVSSEFDQGLGERKAIFVAYPQAIPRIPIIDPSHCRYFRESKCRVCERVCPRGAIDYSQREEKLELEVGAIIVAIGFNLFDPRRKPEYGYGNSPRILTSLQLERLLSSTGPTGGEIRIAGEVPRKFIFIHCVGSRDRMVGHPYCSRFCCMYTAKQALEVKERIPEAEITVCYMDVRAFGKGYEELYERAQRRGILYRRGLPGEIFERDGRVIVRLEDTLLGKTLELEAEAVVLACGAEPPKDALELSRVLGLELDENGFFKGGDPLDPVISSRPGILLAGCCQGPKDISDSVAQASGAASRALALLSQRGR